MESNDKVCQYCGKEGMRAANLARHERSCKDNPINSDTQVVEPVDQPVDQPIDIFDTPSPATTAEQIPWLRGGVNVENSFSWDEAVSASGLDYTVQTGPVWGGPNTTIIPNKRTVYRTDTLQPLTVVGTGYQPIQARRTAQFMDSLIVDRKMRFSRIGILEGGLRFWFLASIDEDIVIGTDVHRPYLLGVNSHDGHRALRFLPTLVNVRRATTLSRAIGSSEIQSVIRHTGNTERKLEAAAKLLSATNTQVLAFRNWLQNLQETSITDSQVEVVETGIFGKETARNELNVGMFRSMYNREIQLNGKNGYALSQAVLDYADHGVNVRSKGSGEEEMLSNLYGAIASLKEKTMHILEEVTGVRM